MLRWEIPACAGMPESVAESPALAGMTESVGLRPHGAFGLGVQYLARAGRLNGDMYSRRVERAVGR